MTSLEWWRSRPAAFAPERIDFPTLDDAWLEWLVARPSPHASLEAMCVYAEDVRQGRWADRVAPEFTVQSVYLVIAQEHLLGAGNRAAFTRDVTVLFDAVARHLERGGSLLDSPFIQQVPSLQRYVSALREDRKLFGEDLRRARKFEISLPPLASTSGSWRSMQCLVLDRPVSTQFKLWARNETAAALLLVRQADGVVVLSVDPTKKARLSWLAPHLSRREGAPWYDGSRHEGTLIASPKSGSKLSLEEVVDELAQHARVMKQRPVAALAALGGAVMLVLVMMFAIGPAHPAEVRTANDTGAKGEPIAPAKVIDLLATPDGPRSFQKYALVAGVCGYTGTHELKSPCRDARAVRDLLVARLGYRREDVLLFLDLAEPGEAVDGRSTAANLKLAVEKFRERTQADETSSFLFYYSGHGGYEKGARKDFGVLQPAGYFDDESLPMSDRGWDMQELLDDLRKGVPSLHVMVVLDACYSGWAVGAKGDEQLSESLRTLWAERAEVVLTAGTKGQRAWEDEQERAAWQWGGHSALTAFLLEGLGASGRLEADRNQDHVVTDEELAQYLKQRVPTAVRASRGADQTPQFFRFDEHLPKSGQFLFVSGDPR